MAIALRLIAAGPRRAAGMLMVTLLFFRLPAVERRINWARVAGQLAFALLVSVLVFVVNRDSRAFLAIIPPVWSAVSLPLRWLSRCSASR